MHCKSTNGIVFYKKNINIQCLIKDLQTAPQHAKLEHASLVSTSQEVEKKMEIENMRFIVSKKNHRCSYVRYLNARLNYIVLKPERVLDTTFK